MLASMAEWLRQWHPNTEVRSSIPTSEDFFFFFFVNVQGVQNGRVGFFKLNYGRTMLYFNILKFFSEFLTMLHFFF